MSAVTFARSSHTPRLFLAEPKFAYLLPSGTSVSDSTLTLEASWNDYPDGCYFFTSKPIDDEALFADVAGHYLSSKPGARFVWVENADDVSSGMQGQFIALTPSDTTDRVSLFDFGGTTLLIGSGCPVSLTANGFEITPAAGGSIALLTQTGYRLEGIHEPLFIAIGDHDRGSIAFPLELGPSELDHLDIGMRLFFEDSRFPEMLEGYFLEYQRYPLFARDIDQLSLYPVLHPLNPLDAERTYFSFTNPRTGSRTTDIRSSYRTTLGYTVHLSPADSGSRLVFAQSPLANQSPFGSPLYLVPSGDFVMTVPRYAPGASQNPADYDDNLLFGLSGVEYVKLAPLATNILRFAPGGKAYVPDFVPGQPPPPSSGRGLLDNLVTTAWAYLQQTDGGIPIFFTQPDQSVLYRTIDVTSPDDPRGDFLHYMEVPVTGLPVNSEASFPLLPYGGVTGEAAANASQLEIQVISPARRALIREIAASDATPLKHNGAHPTGATPQGLLATFSPDYQMWEQLFLAKDTAGKDLLLKNIDRHTPLREALQSNQLFLVISDPESLKTYFTDNQLTIAGWTFDLDPASWSQHGTILILKFYNKPLVELVENLNMWSLPEAFNTSRENTRRQVARLIQDAVKKAPEIEDTSVSRKDMDNYQKLAYAARTKDWAGIIALNVAVPPANFPPELQGLSAGIDQERFYAQYVGIEMTPVRAEDGGLIVGNSSLFGLIDYNDTRAPIPNDTGYNFRVINLSALFLNSQVKDFASEIAITLDKLFEERSVLADSPTGRNDLILKGRYESHNGQNAYSFSFSGSNHFDLPDSATLNNVEIMKAQFTSSAVGTGRFSFWGRLNYKKLEKFDILSFGAEPTDAANPPPNELFLSFSNLGVNMSPDPQDSEKTTFAFDATRMTFDRDKSKSRAQSLYSKFPLKLTGIVTHDGGRTPDSLGYMPVKTPIGSSAPKEGVWYGLTFDLELGSVGALAGKAGIVVSLIAAWTPGESGKVYTGLRLPGSSGGKREISIQGILKIVFKRIEFLANANDEGVVSYLLKLKNVMLKLMVLSIPPNGQTEIIIFGDPNGTAENNTLGWYAAYAKNLPPQQKLPPKDLFSK